MEHSLDETKEESEMVNKRAEIESKYEESKELVENDIKKCKSLCRYFDQCCKEFEEAIGPSFIKSILFNEELAFTCKDDDINKDGECIKDMLSYADGSYKDCEAQNDKSFPSGLRCEVSNIEEEAPEKGDKDVLHCKRSKEMIERSQQTTPLDQKHWMRKEDDSWMSSFSSGSSSFYNADVSKNTEIQSSFSYISNTDAENTLYPQSCADTTDSELMTSPDISKSLSQSNKVEKGSSLLVKSLKNKMRLSLHENQLEIRDLEIEDDKMESEKSNNVNGNDCCSLVTSLSISETSTFPSLSLLASNSSFQKEDYAEKEGDDISRDVRLENQVTQNDKADDSQEVDIGGKYSTSKDNVSLSCEEIKELSVDVDESMSDFVDLGDAYEAEENEQFSETEENINNDGQNEDERSMNANSEKVLEDYVIIDDETVKDGNSKDEELIMKKSEKLKIETREFANMDNQSKHDLTKKVVDAKMSMGGRVIKENIVNDVNERNSLTLSKDTYCIGKCVTFDGINDVKNSADIKKNDEVNNESAVDDDQMTILNVKRRRRKRKGPVLNMPRKKSLKKGEIKHFQDILKDNNSTANRLNNDSNALDKFRTEPQFSNIKRFRDEVLSKSIKKNNHLDKKKYSSRLRSPLFLHSTDILLNSPEAAQNDNKNLSITKNGFVVVKSCVFTPELALESNLLYEKEKVEARDVVKRTEEMKRKVFEKCLDLSEKSVICCDDVNTDVKEKQSNAKMSLKSDGRVDTTHCKRSSRKNSSLKRNTAKSNNVKRKSKSKSCLHGKEEQFENTESISENEQNEIAVIVRKNGNSRKSNNSKKAKILQKSADNAKDVGKKGVLQRKDDGEMSKNCKKTKKEKTFDEEFILIENDCLKTDVNKIDKFQTAEKTKEDKIMEKATVDGEIYKENVLGEETSHFKRGRLRQRNTGDRRDKKTAKVNTRKQQVKTDYSENGKESDEEASQMRSRSLRSKNKRTCRGRSNEDKTVEITTANSQDKHDEISDYSENGKVSEEEKGKTEYARKCKNRRYARNSGNEDGRDKTKTSRHQGGNNEASDEKNKLEETRFQDIEITKNTRNKLQRNIRSGNDVGGKTFRTGVERFAEIKTEAQELCKQENTEMLSEGDSNESSEGSSARNLRRRNRKTKIITKKNNTEDVSQKISESTDKINKTKLIGNTCDDEDELVEHKNSRSTSSTVQIITRSKRINQAENAKDADDNGETNNITTQVIRMSKQVKGEAESNNFLSKSERKTTVKDVKDDDERDEEENLQEINENLMGHGEEELGTEGPVSKDNDVIGDKSCSDARKELQENADCENKEICDAELEVKTSECEVAEVRNNTDERDNKYTEDKLTEKCGKGKKKRRHGHKVNPSRKRGIKTVLSSDDNHSDQTEKDESSKEGNEDIIEVKSDKPVTTEEDDDVEAKEVKKSKTRKNRKVRDTKHSKKDINIELKDKEMPEAACLDDIMEIEETKDKIVEDLKASLTEKNTRELLQNEQDNEQATEEKKTKEIRFDPELSPITLIDKKEENNKSTEGKNPNDAKLESKKNTSNTSTGDKKQREVEDKKMALIEAGRRSTRKVKPVERLGMNKENPVEEMTAKRKASSKKEPLKKKDPNRKLEDSKIPSKKRRTLFNMNKNNSLHSVGLSMLEDTTLNTTMNRNPNPNTSFVPEALQNFLRSFVAPKIRKKAS